MHVPFRAGLGLYARKTRLYSPGRVCTCLFVPVWFCTPGNQAVRPGTCVHVPVRAHLGQYAWKTWLYAPGQVCTCPFVSVWACTPETPLDVWEHARSCPFGPVGPGNLAVRPWTYVYVPVGALLGLYGRETWLYDHARV